MTQLQTIINKLNKDGFIDNFWAIDNKVSLRLGARINDLKKLGWIFKTEKVGKNYYYEVAHYPHETQSSRATISGITSEQFFQKFPLEVKQEIKQPDLWSK